MLWKHKDENAHNLATRVAGQGLSIEKDMIRESIAQDCEHRHELVASINGIDFVNDSKSTNINSTWYALSLFHKPVVLILGGIDKVNNNDYSMLDEYAPQIRAVVIIGYEIKKILRWAKQHEFHVALDMADAVHSAHKFARVGDTVLLSPACASFDWYDNYEHRGSVFKSIVKSI